jgi:predicted enzyme related to lactoylglutathione lyase
VRHTAGLPGPAGAAAAPGIQIRHPPGVPEVETALQKAEALGGTRLMGPVRAPTGLVPGHFTDPAGNVIGIAGAA